MEKVILAFAFGLIGIIGWMIYSSMETPTERAELYQAWRSVNPHQNITFQQWAMLRENDMLPGVDYASKHAKEARDAANSAAMMSGFAAGMAAGK